MPNQRAINRVHVGFFVTAETALKIARRAAVKHGGNVSEWMRGLVQRELARKTKKP